VAAGTPATFLEWAKSQGQRKRAINTKRKAAGQTIFKTDKFGGLINPDKKQDGKLPEYYRQKAQNARAIGEKSKDSKIKHLAEKTAKKADMVAEKLEKSAANQSASIDRLIAIDALIEQTENQVAQADQKVSDLYAKARLLMQGQAWTFEDKPELKKELKDARNTRDQLKESLEKLYQEYPDRGGLQMKPIKGFQDYIANGQSVAKSLLGDTEKNAISVEQTRKELAASADAAMQLSSPRNAEKKRKMFEEYVNGKYRETEKDISLLMDDLLTVINSKAERSGYTMQLATQDAGDVQSDDSMQEYIPEMFLLTGNVARLKEVVRRDWRGSAGSDSIDLGYGTPKGEGKTALFHEYGHIIEKKLQSSSWMQEWVRSRATGESTSLRELTGNNNYESDEKAVPDHFVHPYVGRDYKYEGGSEVFSMGFQHFASSLDMSRLFMKDPEHFYLTLGMLLEAQRRGIEARKDIK
jgi:hypothetical protein